MPSRPPLGARMYCQSDREDLPVLHAPEKRAGSPDFTAFPEMTLFHCTIFLGATLYPGTRAHD